MTNAAGNLGKRGRSAVPRLKSDATILRRILPSFSPTQVAARVCYLATLITLITPVVFVIVYGWLAAWPGIGRVAAREGATANSGAGPEATAVDRSFSDRSPDCGLTKTIIVRAMDGKAVTGVTVRMEARPGSDGGPEIYRTSISGCSQNAMPIITGTLTVRTDSTGLARFELLGRGLWVVWLEGEADGVSIEPRAVQGIPPYGTNPAGGGHLELLDPFNEHVGGATVPEEPVGPVQLASTGAYVLLKAGDSWVPALDLAEQGETPILLPTLPALPILRTPPFLPIPTQTQLPLAEDGLPRAVPAETAATAATAATAEGIETIPPGGDALLRGTPVVVGVVGIEAGGVEVGFPKTGPSAVGDGPGPLQKVNYHLLLVLGAASLGLGILAWVLSYIKRESRK